MKRKPHRPIVFSAVESGDLEMIDLELRKNADLAHVLDPITGFSLLRFAVYNRREEIVRKLLVTAGPLDAFEAASVGWPERLAELLDGGEASLDDMSPDGFGLLHLACFFGRREAAELLVSRGANLEAVARHPMAVRPVHCAAAGRHREILDLLLDAGADVNSAQGGGWTLLHHAAQQGDRDLAESLLGRGANPGVRNDPGKTPAESAAEAGHEELASILGSGA